MAVQLRRSEASSRRSSRATAPAPLLPRGTVQVSYSTRSEQLAKDVQQLLLEFGVVSRRYRHATGEHKVVLTNRRDARLFATRVGFLGTKQDKLAGILGEEVPVSTSLSSDHVPGLAAFLRQHGAMALCRPRLAAPAQRRPDRAVGAARRGDPARTSPTPTPARSRRSWPAAGSTTPRSPSVDRRRCAAGVQPPGRHRRPLVRHRRLRQPQHRMPADPARHGDAAGHRRRHRRLPAELRRQDAGARRPAVARAEPADQRQRRDRGRHGHQHPAAQPAGGRRRRRLGTRAPRGRRGGAARRAHGSGSRAPTSRPPG